MKKYSNLIIFVLLFAIFLFWNVVCVDLYADEVWNYGFSYSIYNGLIPYKDFNMVITPLFPFLMAFFMLIFGSNILVVHVINSLIITIMCFLLYKLIGNNMWFALVFLFIPLPNLFPSYNLFVIFLFILVVFLEKNKANDYLVGFILGLAILTKQSVGVCLFLPSLYYIKDYKRILKRIIGMIIPIIVFFIYLLTNNNLMDFIDLCILGLFDFTKNQSRFNIVYVFSIIYIGICIYFIKKNYKDINNYYALAAFGMTIPLFDLYHFQMSLFCLLASILINHDLKVKLNYKLLFIGVIIGVAVIQLKERVSDGIVYPNNIPHFEYKFIGKSMIEYTNSMNKYLDNHSDRDIVFLTNNAYYLRIIRDEKISKIDLINYGNHGYNGNNKLMKLIKDKKNAIFIVDYMELGLSKQANKNVIRYVINNATKVDELNVYDVYVFNGKYEK